MSLYSWNPLWLVVSIPGYQAQVRRFESSLRALAWSLNNCAALWRAVYGPSATERPLETIHGEKGFLAHRDMI